MLPRVASCQTSPGSRTSQKTHRLRQRGLVRSAQRGDGVPTSYLVLLRTNINAFFFVLLGVLGVLVVLVFDFSGTVGAPLLERKRLFIYDRQITL